MIKKILMKKEIRKFNKLANKETTVLITSGEELLYVYDKKANKKYEPRKSLIVQ